MPTVNVRNSMLTGTTVENVLSGSQWEFLPYNASLKFAIVGDAASHEVLADVYSGQDVLLESGPISSAARFPVNPDDYTLSDVAAGGERIKIRLRNTGAGTHVVQTSVIIEPI